MEKSLKTIAKITKQKDLNGNKMASIVEGRQFNAYFFEWPKLGSSFTFFDNTEFGYKYSVPIATTEVVEIIDEKTFKTRNSIYTIYTIEQEREDKINKILK